VVAVGAILTGRCAIYLKFARKALSYDGPVPGKLTKLSPATEQIVGSLTPIVVALWQSDELPRGGVLSSRRPSTGPFCGPFPETHFVFHLGLFGPRDIRQSPSLPDAFHAARSVRTLTSSSLVYGRRERNLFRILC